MPLRTTDDRSARPCAGRRAVDGWRTRRRRAARAAALAAAAAVLALAPDTAACPRCATAVEAREIAWGDRPLTWLAASAAPFAVMFGIAAWTSRIGRPDEQADDVRRDATPPRGDDT